MTNRTHRLTLVALADARWAISNLHQLFEDAQEQLTIADEAVDDALSYLAGSPVERDGS